MAEKNQDNGVRYNSQGLADHIRQCDRCAEEARARETAARFEAEEWERKAEEARSQLPALKAQEEQKRSEAAAPTDEARTEPTAKRGSAKKGAKRSSK